MSNLTITNARIWTGTEDGLTEGSIHIQDGTVTRIAEPTATQAVADEQVIDAAEQVVIPGLIDNHFHAYAVGMDHLSLGAVPMSYVAHKAAQRLERALKRGFTTVRDVCGGDLGMERAIDEHLVVGPRYLFTGRSLSQTGGHGDLRDPSLELGYCCDHMCEVVDGADAVRTAVRERFRTGAHAIKIMTSGGVMSLSDPLKIPQYSAEEVQAACEEATRRGSYVAAHSYSAESITHSVVNGVRSIEHGNLLDADAAALMAQHGATLVPTLVTYWAMDQQGEALGLHPVSLAKNMEVLNSGKAAIEIAESAGVPVGFGSDLMGDLEVEQLHGLRLQHEVQGTEGLLRSVLTTNASLIGHDNLGRLGEGSAADFLVLARDPFVDPSVLWDDEADARTVFRAGRQVV